MDLNADGYVDVLSGSYSRTQQPMAGLFQVLWGNSSSTFNEVEVLNGIDDEALIIPADPNRVTENICTRPVAVDWDADGDLDLVAGNFTGTFYVFTGKGRGEFMPEPSKVMTTDGPLQTKGAHSDPFPVDWDQDGDIDLLSGSSIGGVQWAENIAGHGETYRFRQFNWLIEPSPQTPRVGRLSEDDLTGPSESTRVWVDDVNSDGKLDLLVGDSVSLATLADGVSPEEFERWQRDWTVAVSKAREEFSEAWASGRQDEVNNANEHIRELYAQRSDFVLEKRTGFVWLYLRK